MRQASVMSSFRWSRSTLSSPSMTRGDPVVGGCGEEAFRLTEQPRLLLRLVADVQYADVGLAEPLLYGSRVLLRCASALLVRRTVTRSLTCTRARKDMPVRGEGACVVLTSNRFRRGQRLTASKAGRGSQCLRKVSPVGAARVLPSGVKASPPAPSEEALDGRDLGSGQHLGGYSNADERDVASPDRLARALPRRRRTHYDCASFRGGSAADGQVADRLRRGL